MKNKTIGSLPTLGQITTEDIINDLLILLEHYNLIECYILNILENNYNEEIEDLILNNDIGHIISNLTYILRNIL